MEKVLDNSHYGIFHWKRNTSSVVVVFSSGGNLALAQSVSEFKKTIEKFDVSYIFFQSKHLDWYNNEFSVGAMRFLANLCERYQHVFAMGESLGGSGALLFCRFFPKIERVLAFSPQYSCLPQFCKWYGPLGAVDGAFKYYTFADYSNEIAREKSVLLFPSRSWEDDLHARFFKSEKYNVINLRTSEHAIAKFLKTSTQTNYLDLCIMALFSLQSPFNEGVYTSLLSPLVENSWMMYRRWIGNMTLPFNHFIDAPLYECISEGCVANQSSVCSYSFSEKKEEDATRAITNEICVEYSFHTDLEKNPWWYVDLGEKKEIKHIRIFNRCDDSDWAQRFMHFRILISDDCIFWKEVYYREESEIIGGKFGIPFNKNFDLSARYVKVQLDGENFLHLSKIEIFGVR